MGKRGTGSGKSKTKKTFKQGLRITFQKRHLDQVWEDVHKGEAFTEAAGSKRGPVGTTNKAELDEDLPAHGAFYCTPCARYFVTDAALALHSRTKPHKRRVKAVGGSRPHNQVDAERAAGKGAPDNSEGLRPGVEAAADAGDSEGGRSQGDDTCGKHAVSGHAVGGEPGDSGGMGLGLGPGSGADHPAAAAAYATADEPEALQDLWRVLHSDAVGDIRQAEGRAWQALAYATLRTFLVEPNPRGNAPREAPAVRSAAVLRALRALLRRLQQPPLRWTLPLVRHMAACAPAYLPEAVALVPLYGGLRVAPGAAPEEGVSLAAWRAAFCAYSRLGDQPAKAAALFTELCRRGVWTPADVWTANIFLDALHSDSAAAFSWHADMEEQGMVSEVDTYCALLKAAMHCSDAARAEAALAAMRRAGLQGDESTHVLAVKAFARAGSLARSLQVLEDALEDGLQPGERVWSSLISVCGRAGQVEMAVALWRRMPAAGVPPSAMALAAVMACCCASLQGERGLALLAEARTAGVRPSLLVYNRALAALRAPRGASLRPAVLEAALGLLQDARESGLRPDEHTYGALFALCTQAGQGDVAQQLQQAMYADGVRKDTRLLTGLIRALGAGGLVDEALAVFGKMVWGPRSRRSSEATHREMLRILREAGRLQEALHVCAGLRKTGGRPSGEEWRALTAAAAEAALREGSTDLACQVAEGLGLNVASADGGPAVVDLHGLGAGEARAAVLCTLRALQQSAAECTPPPAALVLITGVGKRSAEGGPVLREVIIVVSIPHNVVAP
ncbi:hypothetical protein WJX81_003614 [Elliptochloris bilobata]|uniref:C2H2-type domain-containing protein n=1 Tax=Elliptochloris bilobata TaxID=381761 RepID=A0AAW1QM72_9CHLO